MKNWLARDINLYDDFRPIYEPLNIDDKINYTYQSQLINKDSLIRRIFFQLFEKTYF